MARWAFALPVIVTAVASGTKSFLDPRRDVPHASHAFRVGSGALVELPHQPTAPLRTDNRSTLLDLGVPTRLAAGIT